MTVFYWILFSGILMSALALVGSLTLVLKKATLNKLLLPLVSLSAGSLMGGAFFHMLPASLSLIENPITVFVLFMIGFSVFFALEQFLNWHHSHRIDLVEKEVLSYLILIADGLHNLIGGMAVGGAFIADIRLGITTWIVAAAHEIPQELGDFGVLVHSGWKKKNALIFNFLSALTFVVGGVFVYLLSGQLNTDLLVPFAAGNFVYIGASDLIPKLNKGEKLKDYFVHFVSYLIGLLILLLLS